MTAATEELIAALLRERSGYLLAGRTDRAAQVDEQLAAYGYKAPDPKREPPKGRSPRRRQTAAPAGS
jgi:hypothetical protein